MSSTADFAVPVCHTYPPVLGVDQLAGTRRLIMSIKSTTLTPTPSVAAIAEQIGVDLASEPNLL